MILNFCFIRVNGKYNKLYFDDILYIEADKNYPRIVLNNKSFVVLVTLKHLENCLPKNLFCRIHRSYIICLKQITSFDSKHLYIGNKKLPLTRHYKKVLTEKVLIIDQEKATLEMSVLINAN